MSLETYLKNKPIFYKKINYERMPRAFNSIKDKIILKPIIHIVGTNGKGSTGRFLTLLIESLGLKVGHYTSPHIFKFNERFYKNGDIVSDDELNKAHIELQNLLSDEFKNSLSYFEYATLLAAILFEDCDYWVFEAGMGAEFDATNCFDKSLSLFTPIGLDHMEILGNSIEKISHTKLISMAKTAILNDDMNEISVKIAKDIALQKDSNLSFASQNLTNLEKTEIKNYIKKHALANFQISNLTLALAGAKALNLNPDLKNLKKLNLKGRLERVDENLLIDVGHNELAAQNLLKELKNQKFTLIYNAFLDKDYKSVLKTLKPIIKEVQIYDYKSSYRELATPYIKKTCDDLGIKCLDFQSLKKDENYLLFGSFMLVEEFCEHLHKYN